jgi:predicted nucleotidyltransferase component of viral defense system
LATEELFAGKLKAMIDRRHPRDLHDLFRFAKSNLPHDPEILRKLAVLFSSTMDRDFRTYKIDRVFQVDEIFPDEANDETRGASSPCLRGFWYSFGTVMTEKRRNGFRCAQKRFRMRVTPTVGV